MRTLIISVAVSLISSLPAMGQEPIKIGFISTLSGPQGALGNELADGFKLGLKRVGDKLGGRPVQVVYGDDQAKPDVGRQLAEKMVVSDKVNIVTGINFTNVFLAAAKPVLDADVMLLSINSGPSQYAGKQCNKNLFVISFQNDTMFESIGKYLQDKGIDEIYFMAPNYPAGKDMLVGFQRYYKGTVKESVFTAFGQLDYSAEISQLRAKKPKGVVFFYPGGMGINFLKQFTQAGLKNEIPLYTGAGTVDQTMLPAAGENAIGVVAAALWSEQLDNPESRRFAAEFEKEYGRIPSPYAASAYDAVLALDKAIQSIGGKIENKDAFRKAMANVKFDSVRGEFKFNKNQFPIQTFYVTQVENDAKGRPVNKLMGEIGRAHEDAYAKDCALQ